MSKIFVPLRLEDLSAGTVLQENVYSEDGVLLALQGTKLDDNRRVSLIRQGASVEREAEEQARVPVAPPPRVVSTTTIPPEKQEEFDSFRYEYEKKEEEVQTVLADISTGHDIDIDKTFEMVGDIIAKLGDKRDVFTYLNFMKDFDDHTFSHCNNVSLLCNVFGDWIGLNEREMTELTVAGVVHDIGKLYIPKKILNKPGKLTAAEFEIMKSHTTLGYEILKNQSISDEMKLAALLHHEKNDGSGYPFGIKGDRISKYSKIVAICDIYEAMTAKRSYKDKICPFDVIEKFQTGSYGDVDTVLLLVFLRNIAENYIHSWAELSDGSEAEVIFINKADLAHPVVHTKDDRFLNLSERRDIRIERLR